MQTYLFYDIETTGLNKAFDQVLHFAAIRTNLNLEELERYELRIKLNPDCIPSPRAMITHRISMEETLQGKNELEAIKQIHQWLNTPGTISIGYNTLGFDDEFLRFSFYRNLLPPYTHQFANQCGRMDLYPITVMYYLYKNDILQWPQIAGETRLKLELINAANQFIEGQSHHAMVDVEVTLALARRFFQERDMWDYVTSYFNKKTDQERTQQLPTASPLSQREGLMLDGIFGAAQHYQCPVLLLGEHQHYKNQQIWLRLDTQNLTQTTKDTIPETTWGIRKKWGEPGFVLPPKERFLRLNQERIDQANANKAWLAQHPALLQDIIAYHREYTYPNFPDADVESSLYMNGFWSEEENLFCRRFHQVKPSEKAALIETIHNAKLNTLAIRIMGRHFPDALTESQQKQFADYIKRINPNEDAEAITDYKGAKRFSPQMALTDIALLREQHELDLEQQKLLDALESYVGRKFFCL